MPEQGEEFHRGQCKSCGQTLIKTETDCWHPWNVVLPCPEGLRPGRELWRESTPEDLANPALKVTSGDIDRIVREEPDLKYMVRETSGITDSPRMAYERGLRVGAKALLEKIMKGDLHG